LVPDVPASVYPEWPKGSLKMSAHLSFSQIALLVAYAAGMAGGQFLFKMAALRGAADTPLAERLSVMMLNRFFASAVLLYAALTILWVWILSFTPLSRAYVFVALAFAVTPLLGAIVFAEPISVRLVVGVVLIFSGLVFVAG
jgi:drug/metabolite transporter (DMT)-like permease